MSDIASKLLWRTSFGSGSDALISKDMVREAAAEITRLRAELAGKWLPIETPPQIGERVLLFENGQIWLAWWWGFNPSNDRKVNDFEVSRWKPSHWMPLPAPPQPESAT